ncbi:predicted protein [Botrytis cinerea T4]|uniref:Uncharacterized protein n=1 Tax=Botryotinia fuckeliana (strain T4) TaxID=999810 RepID=G2YLP0_BOTF4|nr:predicted protein [Botrytis cinerea T4]
MCSHLLLIYDHYRWSAIPKRVNVGRQDSWKGDENGDDEGHEKGNEEGDENGRIKRSRCWKRTRRNQ